MRTYRYANQYKKVRKSYFLEAVAAFALTFYVGSLIVAAKPAVAADQLFLESLTFGQEPALNIEVETTIAGTSAQIKDDPTLENIVAYITKVFEPEGKHIVVRAINCFYSESGLRPDAVNTSNSNGTIDRGIAQINSIWKMKPEDAHNYRKNIDKAYEIYKRSGSFRPWYGKACN